MQTLVTVTWNSVWLTGKVSLPLILTEPLSIPRKRHHRKKLSFKIPIHDFHEQNTVFHLSSIRCRHRHRCYDYRRRSTMKIKVFGSMRNSHRTWLWTHRRKTNADLRFLMNKRICSILTLQVANVGILPLISSPGSKNKFNIDFWND